MGRKCRRWPAGPQEAGHAAAHLQIAAGALAKATGRDHTRPGDIIDNGKDRTLGLSLDIDLLRSFAAIADSGALSHAAARVGRTQSALSMQIKRLEEIVAQPVLYRTGRGVRLTQAGERLLAHAHKLLSLHDEALTELSGQALSGSLRIGCPDDYAVELLPPLLRGFAARHPKVLMEVECAPTPRLHKLLQRHAIDVALVSMTGDFAPHEAIRVEQMVWVAHHDLDASQLDPLPLALGPPKMFDNLAPRKALELAGRAYRIAYASGSLTGLIALVRSGQAISVLTRTAVPEDFKILPPSCGLPPLPLLGITLAFDREMPSSIARAFGKHVEQMLPTL